MRIILWTLAAVLSAASPVAAEDHFAVWSPDGLSIALTSDRTGDPEIYLARADGSGLRAVTARPGRDAHPAFTPDGRTVLFQSPEEADAVRLFAHSLDSGATRRLTRNDGFCGVPAASPNGDRIAFMCRKARGESWRLFVMSSAGSPATAIGDGPGDDQVPVWTPDGNALVFFSNRSGTDQIYRIDLTAGAVSPVTTGPDAHRTAAFTPDGGILVTIRTTADGRNQLRALDLRNGTDLLILETSSGFGAPSISPDGRRVLYPDAVDGQARIGIADMDGSNRSILEFHP